MQGNVVQISSSEYSAIFCLYAIEVCSKLSYIHTIHTNLGSIDCLIMHLYKEKRVCVCESPILLMHFICMKELEYVWCASCDDELAIGIDLDGSIRHEVFAEQICVDLVCGLQRVDVVPDDLVLIHLISRTRILRSQMDSPNW